MPLIVGFCSRIVLFPLVGRHIPDHADLFQCLHTLRGQAGLHLMFLLGYPQLGDPASQGDPVYLFPGPYQQVPMGFIILSGFFIIAFPDGVSGILPPHAQFIEAGDLIF